MVCQTSPTALPMPHHLCQGNRAYKGGRPTQVVPQASIPLPQQHQLSPGHGQRSHHIAAETFVSTLDQTQQGDPIQLSNTLHNHPTVELPPKPSGIKPPPLGHPPASLGVAPNNILPEAREAPTHQTIRCRVQPGNSLPLTSPQRTQTGTTGSFPHHDQQFHSIGFSQLPDKNQAIQGHGHAISLVFRPPGPRPTRYLVGAWLGTATMLTTIPNTTPPPTT